MSRPVIGITAARRADEQAALVRTLGGVPRHGATIDVDQPAPDDAIAASLGPALDAPLDIAVFLTGVGARHLFAAAERTGHAEALHRAVATARVVVRGGKPRGALRQMDVAADWVAEPAQTRVVEEHLLSGADLRGRRLLVQCAGAEPEPMVAALEGAGARVFAVHPYAIGATRDVRRAADLARDAAEGRLDALTFTNARAVEGFVAIAEREGVDLDAIASGPVVVAAVGPSTGGALRAHGLPAAVEPDTPKMGAMYRALMDHLARRDGR